MDILLEGCKTTLGGWGLGAGGNNHVNRGLKFYLHLYAKKRTWRSSPKLMGSYLMYTIQRSL